ncbi:MAG: hypothetical protein U0838_09635 [Chloroflexota bacterium]
MSAPAGEFRVAVPGGTLWAEAAGEGSGVVLMHAGIADARMWDPQWAALAAAIAWSATTCAASGGP